MSIGPKLGPIRRYDSSSALAVCFEIIYPGLLTFIGVEVFEKFVIVEELVDCVALFWVLLEAFVDEVL